ncbi:MAG: class I poly(R)-hydroxyalkanoic acid synthase [Betaproteobacteria bacterium]|nr:class I poly(R)-hydroxyalkanoic acid synthase [Betaproteobacteria bacterium]
MADESGVPMAPFLQAGQALMQSFFNAMAANADPKTAGALRFAAAQSAQAAHTSDAAAKFSALQSRLMQQHAQLWASMLARQPGQKAEPVASASPGDRRFSGAEWGAEPFYDYMRQSYLINARFAQDAVEALDVDAHAREQLRFSVRQMIDALSPANFAATNPEAMKLALDTQGGSIAQGLKNLLDDVQKGHLTITDESAFEVGRNLAVSTGAVVYENELIQLIQYLPLTAEVHERPLLIVPPCINKFYILDLQPENSFVRHAVEQGHTVFMVSWRNVTAAQGRLTWDDYLDQGVLQAIEAARDISKVERINALGFCVGGTLLSSALAVLAARGEDRVESLTLLASMLDFSDTGELGLFVDEDSIAGREAAIGAGGIMPGKELAFVFSALRANDLVWSYVVNNYLKGRSPAAFDILYWNADSTNLPGPMYCTYLRNMYLTNSLRIPGRLQMLGQPIDLGSLRMPAYILATREDHIVPWKTAYLSTGLLKGDTRFVLGASGHVAGIVNPATKNRRSYWVGTALPTEPDAWFAQAAEQPGSWWRDWMAWLSVHAGAKRKAKKRLGGGRHMAIEPAPGRFVREPAQ